MIEVEVFGADAPAGSVAAERVPAFPEICRLCELAAGATGVREGHVAIEFVDERRITELNERFRAQQKATDVLSFPIDGAESTAGGAHELGDVVICLEHTADVREAIVHGVLHLVGMDHETDEGQMLALQAELLARGDS